MEEQTLVLIKPDAMAKQLAGNIISDLYHTGLKIIGLKLVAVSKELAEKHYEEHKEKPFFDNLIDHITGKLHNNEKVIAIIYQGKDAIAKIRSAVGNTNPDESPAHTIRGKYGKIHSVTNCHETVIHASDSSASAKREIAIWFKPEEIVK
jgi:nucleoside-diphosphate kinase